MIAVVWFLVFTAFCYWAIVRDGVEAMQDWKGFLLLGSFAATLTPRELKFSLAIAWLTALVLTAVEVFSATPG